jgi:hypothetical protein
VSRGQLFLGNVELDKTSRQVDFDLVTISDQCEWATEMALGGYHRPVIVKAREMRNEARAMMKRKLGVKAIEGKDIDHKTPVRAHGALGGNNMANLRVRSRHANRGWDKKR